MEPYVGCGYPHIPGVSEWTCNKNPTHVVVGVHGTDFYQTEMPRCADHVQDTIVGLNPPNSPYPHESIWEVRRFERKYA